MSINLLFLIVVGLVTLINTFENVKNFIKEFKERVINWNYVSDIAYDICIFYILMCYYLK